MFMKKVGFILAAVLSVVCYLSCSKQEVVNPEVDLFAEMVNYSQKVAAEFQNLGGIKTRADYSGSKEQHDTVDICQLDEKFIDYIDLYSMPEDMSEWNEAEILNLISNDENFTSEEKLVFARSLSVAYYIKNTSDLDLTKAYVAAEMTSNDCLAAYKSAKRKAARRCVIIFAAGLLIEPTSAVECYALLDCAISIQEAGEDYEYCMSKVVR